MLTGIDHVQITIPEGQELQAKDFYCRLLGLIEIEKPDVLKPNGGFWLQLGSLQIHVGTEPDVDRFKTKAHVAYAVMDIESWRRKLETAGVELTNHQPIPGYLRFEFRDPFGNRVEFIEKTG